MGKGKVVTFKETPGEKDQIVWLYVLDLKRCFIMYISVTSNTCIDIFIAVG